MGNLLHYALAVIYVQSDDERRIFQFMRTFLALYRLGISVSSVLMSLLSNFFASFIVAVVILGLSLAYLSVWIPMEQVYLLVAIPALGLPAPSLIKSFTAARAKNKALAMTGLADMGITGVLLSSVLLSGFQSRIGDISVFFVLG